MSPPPPALVLLLDEMFSPRVCQVLRERGHSVLGVVERLDLRSAPDKDVYAWAASTGCWIMAENVKDFRPIAAHASQSGSGAVGLLYTSSRAFPRSRANIARWSTPWTNGYATDRRRRRSSRRG